MTSCPNNYDFPEQVRDLSNDDLKQAAQAAFERNVMSPLAKAVFFELFCRWAKKETKHD